MKGQDENKEIYQISSLNPKVKEGNDNRYKYNIQIDVTCNTEAQKGDKPEWKYITGGDSSLITLQSSSYYACGFDATRVLQLFKTYWYITIPIMMGLGLFLCLVGHKVFKATLLISGFIGG